MNRRIAGLDIARGIAILGTLATNIWIFSHPAGMPGYFDSPVSSGVPAWQAGTEQVLQQLANGKFLGLLTLMLGIGLAIQADSAQRSGRSWPGGYVWRAAILFLDGLLHYVLVVEFDVLMGYAITGAIVAYVVARSPRAQWRWIAGAGGVHLTMVALITVGIWLSPSGSLGWTPQPNPYRTGSWWDLVLLRLDATVIFRFEPVFILALGIALFTLGNRLYRRDLFTVEGGPLRRRLLLAGAIALPIDLALGLSSPNWMFVTRYVLAPVVALGLLALIAEVTLTRRPGWVGRRLGELGRVALSAYVLQNILASALFYGWGLDLGGLPVTWRLPVTVLGWVLVSTAVLAFAHVWLRRWRRGPLEWLWTRTYTALGRPEQAAPTRSHADEGNLVLSRISRRGSETSIT